MPRPFLASVTRISDLTPDTIDAEALPREAWAFECRLLLLLDELMG